MRSRSAASAIASSSVDASGASATSCSGDRAEAGRVGEADGGEDVGRHRLRRGVRGRRAAGRAGPMPASVSPRPRRAARTAAGCRDWCCSRRRRSVASTARRMRCADARAPDRRSNGAAAAAALPRSAPTSMPWPPAWTCTLPGFSAASSARQAARNRPRDLVSLRPGMRRHGAGARRRPRGNPRRSPRRCRCRRRFAGRARRVGVDLEHHEPPVRRADQIDAGVVGADGGAARRQRAARISALGTCAHGSPPWCTLVIQVPAAARHGGDDAVARDDDAPVLEASSPDGGTKSCR